MAKGRESVLGLQVCNESEVETAARNFNNHLRLGKRSTI